MQTMASDMFDLSHWNSQTL